MITTIIIDRGHGLLDKQGNYVTPGKRATLPDGRVVFEGLENNKYAKAIAKAAKEAGFNVIFTVLTTDFKDMSLVERVNKANKHPNKNSAIFLSLHNNAANGKAFGTELFTSKGQTLSDIYAQHIIDRYRISFPNRRIRTDKTDKDCDKESNFYVLARTIMPSILFEFGFFDNPTDYDWLSNEKNIDLLAKCTIDGIVSANIDLYGEHIYPIK